MNAETNATSQARGAPESRSTQFVPVEGGGSETTDAGTFMVAAYVLMWLCTLFFILHTWRRMRGVQARVEELQKAIARLPTGQ
jgi:TRAP-type C4-dicarboxylate transport system permease small subunit